MHAWHKLLYRHAVRVSSDDLLTVVMYVTSDAAA
jgi:hypothetical protein